MTESDWERCADPAVMLAILQDGGTASRRNLRLFAVGCLRRWWHLFKHADVLRGLEVAEQFADGRATDEELRTARELMTWAGDDASWRSMPEAAAAWAAASAAEADGIDAARNAASEVCRLCCEDLLQHERERLAQCHLLRDMMGRLAFCPLPPLAPARLTWNDGTVRRLAMAAYEERLLPSGHLAPARLAVLADALEEAGCTDANILGHLRGPGPHVRGCWAVDALLHHS